MRYLRLHLVGIAFCSIVAACGTPSSASLEDGGGDSAEPVAFTDEQWALIRSLSSSDLGRAPPDVSNVYADSSAAAAFGRTLFFDPGFSGALLDKDNDGSPNSLGERSATGRVACAGCHQENAGFSDVRSTFAEISLGAGWTKRRTPSLLNIGQAKMVLWGGKHSTLHGQALDPLENPLEMNTSRLYVAVRMYERYRAEYEAIFGQNALSPLGDTSRFPRIAAEATGCRFKPGKETDHPRGLALDAAYTCHGMPGDGAEHDGMTADDKTLVTRVVVNFGKAIAAFERTLACGTGRFDAFASGNTSALTPDEQRGLEVFIGKGRCVTCHTGPYFSDQQFHNVGAAQTVTREGILNQGDRGAAVDLARALADPLRVGGAFSDGDDGRLPSAVLPSHEGAFRTPMLRCTADRPTYLHTGLVVSLDTLVGFFDRGGDAGGFPGTNELTPLGLSLAERRQLAAFLRSLDATK